MTWVKDWVSSEADPQSVFVCALKRIPSRMKTLSFVSALRKASIALAIAVFAAMPAWAGKYASIVVDLDTAQVLHARDADEVRYPASLTKVMTLYMVFDALDAGKLKLNERLPVSKAASRQQPSK